MGARRWYRWCRAAARRALGRRRRTSIRAYLLDVQAEGAGLEIRIQTSIILEFGERQLHRADTRRVQRPRLALPASWVARLASPARSLVDGSLTVIDTTRAAAPLHHHLNDRRDPLLLH